MKPVAYLSMEFGIDDSLPIFAGGLGILAGDILLEAAAKKRPLIGIGLLYHKGYLQQHISETGEQTEGEFLVDLQAARLEQLTDPEGRPLRVSVPLMDRDIVVQAWRKRLSSDVWLLLLDTRVDDNSVEDREIGDQLYAGDKEHRLKQEIVLGIGGVRMLDALGIIPCYYHLNEAHCAFAIFELLRRLRKNYHRVPFSQLLTKVGDEVVFTNHTIVPAGNDVFSEELVSLYLDRYIRELPMPLHEFLKLGKMEDATMFSMTLLALRFAKRVNAVSRLHAEVAATRWPGFEFVPITNGIHLPRWLGEEMAAVWPLGQHEPCAERVFWRAHQAQKRKLLALVAERTGTHLAEDVLTVTWARRITSYKRPGALLYDLVRLKRLLTGDRPVQILMAGKVHPQDTEGKEFVRYVHSICADEAFSSRLRFIPNYDIRLAQALVAGSDVWLNTPLRGYEASGTSGMKACLNGVLQMTTKDGWTDDVEWEKLGWTLDAERVSDDVYRFLETEVSELFYQNRDAEGFCPDWVQRMIRSSFLTRQRYSTARVLEEYYQKLYI